MSDGDLDGLIRMAAFEHVRTLGAVHDHLTTTELAPGFNFRGERIPLINPQRGIFKPQQMRFLLSIRTVFPRVGRKVWYDDQREVHRQIFEVTRRSNMRSWAITPMQQITAGYGKPTKTPYRQFISWELLLVAIKQCYRSSSLAGMRRASRHR